MFQLPLTKSMPFMRITNPVEISSPEFQMDIQYATQQVDELLIPNKIDSKTSLGNKPMKITRNEGLQGNSNYLNSTTMASGGMQLTTNFSQPPQQAPTQKTNHLNDQQSTESVLQQQPLQEEQPFEQQCKRHQLFKFSDVDGSGDLYRGGFIVVTRLSGREIIKHGLGTIQYANGSVYEGMWVRGQREGYGRLIHPTGDMYEGDWMNDKANGRGTFSNLDGYTYEGEWLDDCQHGEGVETWDSNESKYTGNFKDSKKSGKGRYEWADGSYYEGDFADGVFDGQGTYYFADLKKTYTGEFRNANMEGFGTEVYEADG